MKQRTGIIIGRKRRFTLVCFVVISLAMLFFVFITDIRNEYAKPASDYPEIPNGKYEKTLLVVADKNYYPYSYYDEDNNVCGYDVELITIIANKMQMNLDIRLLDRKEIFKRVNDGLADVVLSCDCNSKNLEEVNLLKTQPVEVSEFAAFGKKPVHSFADLYDKRIAYPNDGNIREILSRYMLLDDSYVFASAQEAFEAVKNGRCDYAISRFPVGAYIIANNSYGDIKPYAQLGSSDMCFGICPARKDLVRRLDFFIKELKEEGTLSELNKKWIVANRYSVSLQEFIKQNSWIAIFPCVILIIALLAILLESDHSKLYLKKDNIISLLADRYDAVILVDPKTEEVSLLKNSEYNGLFASFNPQKDNYSDWIERSIKECVYKDDVEYVTNESSKARILDKLSDDQKGYTVSYRINHNKSFLYYEAEISTFTDNIGNKQIMICFCNKDAEVRQKIHQTEEVEQALKLAKAGNDAKNRFLFNISHDVKTPLNIIQGYSEILSNNIEGESHIVRDSLEKIKLTVNYLIQFMKDVLEVSKIETDKIVLNLSAVDFIEEENSLCELVDVMTKGKNLTFKTDFSGVTDRYVWRDSLRVTRIISNMLNNSIKFTPSGGTIEYIISQVTCSKPGYASYIFTVKDTGCGMSKEFVSHIYEMFEREKTSSLSGNNGVGLGMTVVKRLVDLLKGKIEIESEVNVGTTIRIKLDFMLSSEKEVNEKKIRYENAGVNLENMSILLAEDNRCNREITKLLLENEGVSVEEATNGREAVQKLFESDSGTFDAVLMDIQMPFMDGYAATKQIRHFENEEIAHIPIIAFSANAFEEDRQKAFESGMDDFVEKPLDVKKLLNILNRFWKQED